MEKQLFDWGSWEQDDTMAFQFMDCTMNVDFGLLKKGQKFECISLDYGNGLLRIWGKGEKPEVSISLRLAIA